jgi:competence protein CoiA
MLCAQRQSDNVTVIASEASKVDVPFACPACKRIVILKKGTKVTHHYAHKPPVDCVYGTGESEAHRHAKMEIYEALRASPRTRDIRLERYLGTVRPDISGFINGVRVAIEMQISTLSLGTIHHRTVEYANKGINLLWLSPWQDKLNSGRYTPRIWEKWIHGLYFGHVYYWHNGAVVWNYKLGKYTIEVPEREWYDGWHDDGDPILEYAGGYSYRSKRWRTPVKLGELNLLTDFSAQRRSAWNELPDALLFTGRCR